MQFVEKSNVNTLGIQYFVKTTLHDFQPYNTCIQYCFIIFFIFRKILRNVSDSFFLDTRLIFSYFQWYSFSHYAHLKLNTWNNDFPEYVNFFQLHWTQYSIELTSKYFRQLLWKEDAEENWLNMFFVHLVMLKMYGFSF